MSSSNNNPSTTSLSPASSNLASDLIWHKVLDDAEQLPEGRVTTASAGHKTIALSKFKNKITAMDNDCPHQKGPIGEGCIEEGMIRCPWHGWAFDAHSGKSPNLRVSLAVYPLEIRDDGVYVGMEAEQEHQETVSDIMVKTMINWGVDSVFGMVGHSNLGFADALRRQELKGNLTFYGVRHEGAASFAASAYGKLTGKPAVCFTIAGPGATNLYTGLWDAKVDRSPLLAITGQVDTQVMGTGNFQEVDLTAAFQSVAEFNHRVLADSKHAELMSRALKQAIINRTVSHLTLPDEVQTLPAHNEKPQQPQGRVADVEISPSVTSINAALILIKKAKRPVIIVGHGAKFSIDKIIALAEKINAPIATTFKGKGIIADSHPLACGVLGRSGTPIASWFMNSADLLIVLGASFAKHTGITPMKPIIQIDFDRLAIGKHHAVDVPIWGELAISTAILTEQLDKVADQGLQAEVAYRWSLWRAEKQSRLADPEVAGLSSIAVFDALTRLAPANAVMCVDVGNNAYSFGRYFESNQHDFLMSGYLGSIGFALPAAIGAKAAVKDSRPVIAVAGDGGIGQYLAEITTIVKYKLNIKLIIINNNEIGKISKEQKAGQFDVWSTAVLNPHFADFAASCGAWAKRVEHRDQLDDALKQAFSHPASAVVEIMTDVKLI
ncbi:MAG: Rieske 2Fe-2S domain-containing protein [Oceanospirillaceae bacterium]|nr:Rieske 2Fe-2S domain-containing protein [Oceanospirillaceae bacterium]